MNLPPLPTALVRGPAGTGSYFDSYTAAQMTEYGQACRDAALEEAAQKCEVHLYRDYTGAAFDYGPDLPANQQMLRCITTIRNMLGEIE